MPPTQEYFDVVDTGDRVLWQATRAEVHRRGWIHRAVHILVHNKKGELYLQRRSMSKDSFPGCWCTSCSGHVDAGETYGQAAPRELAEELNPQETPPLRPLGRVTPSCPATGQEHLWLYTCPCSGPFQPDPVEVIEGRWLKPQAIDRWIARSPADFADSFAFLWKHHFGPWAHRLSSWET